MKPALQEKYRGWFCWFLQRKIDGGRSMSRAARARPSQRALWDDWARSTSSPASAAGRGRRRPGGSGASPSRRSACCPTISPGKDAIELGCGTAYVSAWLARRGARVVGIDNSAGAARHGAPPAARARSRVPAAPRQRRGGALSRCELRLRDLRVRRVPVGRPASLGARSGAPAAPGRPAGLPRQLFLMMLCMPAEDDVAATDRLLRPAFGMYRVEWPGDPASSFTSRTATGSACCAAADSRSRIWSSAPAARRDDALSVRHARVGAAVAVRRGVEGAPDWLRQPW